MPTPTGRAGRPWLAHRLETARRGAEVLDEKRQALLRLERSLVERLDEAESEWARAAREARLWLERAAFLGGERSLELAAAQSRRPVEVRIEWRRTLGLAYPAAADVELPPWPESSPLGGSSALVLAAAAHRRALEAAARAAVARTAHDRVVAELGATTRRLRAVERRWIPRHEDALAALELALDEGEREENTRLRWIIGRGSPSPASGTGRTGPLA